LKHHRNDAININCGVFSSRIMLPNLSSLTLSIDVKRNAEDAGLDSSIAVSLQNVDWKNLVKKLYEDNDPPIVIAVYVPRPGGNKWTLKFEVTAFNIQILSDGSDYRCFDATIYASEQDYDLSINSLFHRIDSQNPALCNIEPNIEDTAGYGSAVLQVMDVMAGSLGGNISLSDAAYFRANDTQIPKVNVSEGITRTLALLRGFGFYEARGLIPIELFEAERDTSLYAAAEEVDLEWTHMVVTTPINELQEAICNFYKKVDERGNTVPAFTRELYSQDSCKGYADNALPFLDDFKVVLNEAQEIRAPVELGIGSYADASSRALAQATASGIIHKTTLDSQDLSLWMQRLFDLVWRRKRKTINMDGTEVVSYYGDAGASLVKVLHKSSNGSLFYNAVIPNPYVIGNVPVVRMQPVRTDLEVVYRP